MLILPPSRAMTRLQYKNGRLCNFNFNIIHCIRYEFRAIKFINK